MQDLTYSRDRVGNITAIADAAQDTLYFNNTTVTADQTFVYDGLYRLTAATGREKDSLGQPGATYSSGTGSIPHAAGSMRQYRQEYDYDEAGNIIQMVHSAGPSTGGTTFWRRVYAYEDKNNQLIANSKPGESVTKTRAELQADPSSVDLSELNDTYAYNDRGAMTYLPHLDTSGSTNVTRDFRDQIRELAVGTSAGTAHYAYDAGGIRVAKLWDKGGAAELRVYIGSYEIFRSASSVSGLTSPSTELHTLHVMDGERRVAMVETYTAGAPTGVTGNRIRMQLGNHLGTACIETDKDGGLLTYEEFHPYGTTAWWAEKSGLEVSTKRYRYTGMERDEESGLQYHNARYYMPWLGRWERADPAQQQDGPNRHSYSRLSPAVLLDLSGTSSTTSSPSGDESTDSPEMTDGQLASTSPKFQANSDVLLYIQGGTEGHEVVHGVGYYMDGALNNDLSEIAVPDGRNLTIGVVEPGLLEGDTVEAGVAFVKQHLRPDSKLIIMGYSRGGAAALSIAERLDAEGTEVDLLVTIDPALPGSGPGVIPSIVEDSVPDNVRTAVNYYQLEADTQDGETPSLRVLDIAGGPLEPADSSTTAVFNIMDPTTSHQQMDEVWRPDAITQISSVLDGQEVPDELKAGAAVGNSKDYPNIQQLGR